MLGAHAPSLVLTDYNLAGRWNGIDLLLWMRRSARLRNIPTLLMTGDDPEEIRGRLAAAGLGDVEVIAKPFEARELIEELARSRQRGRRAAPSPTPGALRGADPPPPECWRWRWR